MARKDMKRGRLPEKTGRPKRKRTSLLTIAKIDYVDYKDVDLLKKFISERSKIKARYNSGNDAQQQRTVAKAIKNAREMALLPYTQRLTTQRRERRGGERETRAAGPPPQPTAPPPGQSEEQDDFEGQLMEEEGFSTSTQTEGGGVDEFMELASDDVSIDSEDIKDGVE
tara:strand:+ start:601 stop:1107 length:507 start_codon:yes stop_codon:yes gene_type:complete